MVKHCHCVFARLGLIFERREKNRSWLSSSDSQPGCLAVRFLIAVMPNFLSSLPEDPLDIKDWSLESKFSTVWLTLVFLAFFWNIFSFLLFLYCILILWLFITIIVFFFTLVLYPEFSWYISSVSVLQFPTP